MGLIEALKGARILETIENYSLASDSTEDKENSVLNLDQIYHHDEGNFWKQVTNNPDLFWYKNFNFQGFVLSDWVARVPGLFWVKSSLALRRHLEVEVAIKSKTWVELHPLGKSRKVLGGTGTLLLPPSDDGKKLMSITSSFNASLGIPILVYPEVYEFLNLSQGDNIELINVKWQPMTYSWAQRFASTKGIPRGFLVLDTIDKVRVVQKGFPISYQPFSIMEYEKGDAILYDFVFLSIDTSIDNQYKRIEEFFNYYKSKEDRTGKYLINPNLIQPMFECRYMSPVDIHNNAEIAHLSLIHKRISDQSYNTSTLEEIIIIVPKFYDSLAAMRRLTTSLGINSSLISEGRVVDMSAQLINYCLENGKMQELIDRITFDFPNILNN